MLPQVGYFLDFNEHVTRKNGPGVGGARNLAEFEIPVKLLTNKTLWFVKGVVL